MKQLYFKHVKAMKGNYREERKKKIHVDLKKYKKLLLGTPRLGEERQNLGGCFEPP